MLIGLNLRKLSGMLIYKKLLKSNMERFLSWKKSYKNCTPHGIKFPVKNESCEKKWMKMISHESSVDGQAFRRPVFFQQNQNDYFIWKKNLNHMWSGKTKRFLLFPVQSEDHVQASVKKRNRLVRFCFSARQVSEKL